MTNASTSTSTETVQCVQWRAVTRLLQCMQHEHRQQHGKAGATEAVPPLAFPTAIMSIDPGEVNFGVCVLQIDPAWLQKSQKQTPNMSCLEQWEIPVYRVALWGIIECRASKPKSKKKGQTTSAPFDMEHYTQIARMVTTIVGRYGVQCVLLETQLEAARRNQMIELVIVGAITAINETYPCELVHVRATQKFDFEHSELQSILFRARNRLIAQNKIQKDTHAFRKVLARAIVLEIMENTVPTQLGLEYIDPVSLHEYEAPLRTLEKQDDACDTLLQIVAYFPHVLAHVLAQNRHAETLNSQALAMSDPPHTRSDHLEPTPRCFGKELNSELPSWVQKTAPLDADVRDEQ